jgi:hypothetical protein
MREPNCQQHLQKGRKVAEPSQRALGNGRRIEDLAEKIESCRKFILASRIAVAGGVLVFSGMLFGAIRFDPGIMAAAVAALLGGIAVWGSNRSTAKQAANELALAESDRSVLIGNMALGDVTPLRGFTIESQDETTA